MNRLQELIEKTERAGFRVIGFLVAPDVMRELERVIVPDESGMLRSPIAMRQGLTIEECALLPRGAIAPKTEPAFNPQGWPGFGDEI